MPGSDSDEEMPVLFAMGCTEDDLIRAALGPSSFDFVAGMESSSSSGQPDDWTFSSDMFNSRV